MIKTVLFDLDGTLLPMDQDVFTQGYFRLLSASLAPHGYNAKELVAAVWKSTAAMVANDGSKPNCEAFWTEFQNIFGEKVESDIPYFDAFYDKAFDGTREFCGFNKHAAEVVSYIKSKGGRTVLATNPIFPAVATLKRARWAGLDPDDFELVTTYENTGYCKPNPDYYRDILERTGATAETALMVGNDAHEDAAAQSAGLDVFLLTDCLINRTGVDIDKYPHGSFDALEKYLKENMS